MPLDQINTFDVRSSQCPLTVHVSVLSIPTAKHSSSMVALCKLSARWQFLYLTPYRPVESLPLSDFTFPLLERIEILHWEPPSLEFPVPPYEEPVAQWCVPHLRHFRGFDNLVVLRRLSLHFHGLTGLSLSFVAPIAGSVAACAKELYNVLAASCHSLVTLHLTFERHTQKVEIDVNQPIVMTKLRALEIIAGGRWDGLSARLFLSHVRVPALEKLKVEIDYAGFLCTRLGSFQTCANLSCMEIRTAANHCPLIFSQLPTALQHLCIIVEQNLPADQVLGPFPVHLPSSILTISFQDLKHISCVLLWAFIKALQSSGGWARFQFLDIGGGQVIDAPEGEMAKIREAAEGKIIGVNFSA